ncbi:MAG: hypothetical protein COW02_01480 [Comamonadaceae bacterium CG12_big_fil_rev_8_21_14_0_65_59_15]|nr:MAG: hypothetical protein COW02_01480 [Comamonadaceae bacterium CG12_big_fil_rev_8_21_14_0_65_59_15]
MKASSPNPPQHLCPLCGQPNQCAMHARQSGGVAQEPCWCTQVKMGADLLNRVPKTARGKVCVCEACARAANSAR